MYRIFCRCFTITRYCVYCNICVTNLFQYIIKLHKIITTSIASWFAIYDLYETIHYHYRNLLLQVGIKILIVHYRKKNTTLQTQTTWEFHTTLVGRMINRFKHWILLVHCKGHWMILIRWKLACYKLGWRNLLGVIVNAHIHHQRDILLE